ASRTESDAGAAPRRAGAAGSPRVRADLRSRDGGAVRQRSVDAGHGARGAAAVSAKRGIRTRRLRARATGRGRSERAHQRGRSGSRGIPTTDGRGQTGRGRTTSGSIEDEAGRAEQTAKMSAAKG